MTIRVYTVFENENKATAGRTRDSRNLGDDTSMIQLPKQNTVSISLATRLIGLVGSKSATPDTLPALLS